MTTVSSTALAELFPENTAATAAKNNVDELGQDDFMTLMVAQLKNQDPTKPMDNMQFLAQIAQFGTVSGIQELQNSFAGLASALYASQTVQAASLVGRDVETQSNVGTLTEGETLNATLDIPANANAATVYVQDPSGRLVYSQSLGAVAGGSMSWQWDGVDASGNSLPPGNYRVSAEVLVGNTNRAVPVYTHHRVASVSIENGGNKAVLNLADGSSVTLSQIRSIL